VKEKHIHTERHVFYGILTFFCITFDALEIHLIVTDVVVTLTLTLSVRVQ